jgi:threonylcarbamoyladenosine tRNA methylthiotransferase MtaB
MAEMWLLPSVEGCIASIMTKPRNRKSKISRTVAFMTLGCKVNQYETQAMRESLKKSGYAIVAPEDVADIYIINTCTVTGISDRKSRQAIRRANVLNPDALVVVTGCYAERSPDKIANMPGVDLVLSNSDKPFICQYLSDSALSQRGDLILNDDPIWSTYITSFNGHTRALVKIQDGCDSFCTYCIVPHVRGEKINSRPLDSIVREVRSLAENGYREIVLTGIHLGAYGRDMANGMNLAHVLRTVQSVENIQRIRLSSIEPMDITDDLIDAVANLPGCAHHFHISLQSGSDRILKLMRRGYTSAEFEDMANRIKAAIPDVGLSTDVMVGFPGETEQDFKDTCDLIARVEFSRLHVFRYSPRSGTPAAKFPHRVQESVAYRRSQEVRSLGESLAQKFRSQMLGQVAEVLVEDTREGKDKLLAGFTSNYVRVLIPDAPDELAGQMAKVKLVDMKDKYMIGIYEDLLKYSDNVADADPD